MKDLLEQEKIYKPIKILLVEDDDADALAVKRSFRKENLESSIYRAKDGVEALEMLKGQNGKEKIISPYMCLVDLNMPRMNGIELIQKMRQDEELQPTIVMILTTSKRDQDLYESYQLNVAGYILKDINGGDFSNLVRLLRDYWKVVEFPQ